MLIRESVLAVLQGSVLEVFQGIFLAILEEVFWRYCSTEKCYLACFSGSVALKYTFAVLSCSGFLQCDTTLPKPH